VKKSYTKFASALLRGRLLRLCLACPRKYYWTSIFYGVIILGRGLNTMINESEKKNQIKTKRIPGVYRVLVLSWDKLSSASGFSFGLVI